jgi:hypothetical protein
MPRLREYFMQCGQRKSQASRSFARLLSLPLVYSSLVLGAVVLHGGSNCALAELAPGPLERIPSGTVVWEAKSGGFSNVILFVKGRMSAGDVDSVSSSMKYYGDLFNLVYLANATATPGQGYSLDRIAVGFSTKIDGKDVVITADTAKSLGAGLNFIGKSVLSGNEDALKAITLTASNRTSAVVDAPAVMLYQDKHQLMNVRFFIWVSPDGKIGTAAWLLQRTGDQLTFADKTFQYLPPAMIEDRVLHVDGSRITLGIPSSDALALVTIPQGKPYNVTDRLRQTGASAQFNADSLNQLAASLAEAMGMK